MKGLPEEGQYEARLNRANERQPHILHHMYFHHFQVTEPLTFDPNLPLLAVLIESFSMLGYLFVPIKYRDTRRMPSPRSTKVQLFFLVFFQLEKNKIYTEVLPIVQIRILGKTFVKHLSNYHLIFPIHKDLSWSL